MLLFRSLGFFFARLASIFCPRSAFLSLDWLPFCLLGFLLACSPSVSDLHGCCLLSCLLGLLCASLPSIAFAWLPLRLLGFHFVCLASIFLLGSPFGPSRRSASIFLAWLLFWLLGFRCAYLASARLAWFSPLDFSNVCSHSAWLPSIFNLHGSRVLAWLPFRPLGFHS